MKRAIGLILVAAACIVAFLSVRGNLPFMPIYGHSMEPALQSGGLLMIKSINPEDIQVGDIIVYTIPPMVRSYYNYPPTIAHRVTKVNTVPSLSFRTQGDNTGEDPFTVRPDDIRGTVGSQIPYIGLPLLSSRASRASYSPLSRWRYWRYFSTATSWSAAAAGCTSVFFPLSSMKKSVPAAC